MKRIAKLTGKEIADIKTKIKSSRSDQKQYELRAMLIKGCGHVWPKRLLLFEGHSMRRCTKCDMMRVVIEGQWTLVNHS
jgi:hypothetical protein